MAPRLAMERICPTKDRPVGCELPGTATAAAAELQRVGEAPA